MKTGTGSGKPSAAMALISDALGQEKTRISFNDPQHTTKTGARVNTECVVDGIRRLQNCPLARSLRVAKP